MHSIGNVIFISDIFNKIANLVSAFIGKTGISSQAEITVIGINLPADKQSAFKNFNLHCIGSKDLARYVPNDPKVKWIDFIDISGIVIVAPDQKSASSIFEELQMDSSVVNGSYEIGNYVYSANNNVSMDLNLYGLGFIDGKLVQLNDDVPFGEGIYHELMHAYTYYNLHKNTGKAEEEDSDYDKAVRYTNIVVNSSDDIAHGVYALCASVYALSDDEMKAYIGMNYEHFKDMTFDTKEDFFDAIKSSNAGTIIANAQMAIDFLGKCKSTDIRFKRISYILDGEYTFAPLSDLVSMVLDTLFLKANTTNLEKHIEIAILKLTRRLKVFKVRVYNVAYDAVYNKQEQ